MKKSVSLLFAFVLLFSSFFLISCSNSDVELTLENYDKYISINTYFSDIEILDTEDGFFNVYAIGNITTDKKSKLNFENCYIEFKISGNGSNKTFFNDNIVANLSYDGKSHVSFEYLDEHTSTVYIPETLKPSTTDGFGLNLNIKIVKISGRTSI